MYQGLFSKLKVWLLSKEIEAQDSSRRTFTEHVFMGNKLFNSNKVAYGISNISIGCTWVGVKD